MYRTTLNLSISHALLESTGDLDIPVWLFIPLNNYNWINGGLSSRAIFASPSIAVSRVGVPNAVPRINVTGTTALALLRLVSTYSTAFGGTHRRRSGETNAIPELQSLLPFVGFE